MSNPTINIGVAFDLKRPLKDLEKQIGNVEQMGVDLGVSKETQKEIDSIKSGVQDLYKTVERLGKQKINSEVMQQYHNDISKQLTNLETRSSALEQNFKTLIQTMNTADGGKFQGVLDQYNLSMQSVVENTSKATETIKDLTKAASSNVEFHVVTKEQVEQLEGTIDLLKSVKKIQANATLSDKTTAQRILTNRIKGYLELKKTLAETPTNSINYADLQDKIGQTIYAIKQLEANIKASFDEESMDYGEIFDKNNKEIGSSCQKLIDTIDDTISKTIRSLQDRVQELTPLVGKELDKIADDIEEKSNGKGYVVPVGISTTDKQLANKVIHLVERVRPLIANERLEVGVSIVTEWGNRKQRKLLEELQAKLDSLTVDADVSEVKQLYQDITKYFNDEITLKIRSDIDKVAPKIKAEIDSIRQSLRDEPLNLDLNNKPYVEQLSDEQKEASKYAHLTAEELQQCLSTEERYLKKCKEGSDKYKERKTNIEEINRLLAEQSKKESQVSQPLKIYDQSVLTGLDELADKLEEISKSSKPISEDLFSIQESLEKLKVGGIVQVTDDVEKLDEDFEKIKQDLLQINGNLRKENLTKIQNSFKAYTDYIDRGGRRNYTELSDKENIQNYFKNHLKNVLKTSENDYRTSGRNVGLQFAEGITESIGEIVGAVTEMVNVALETIQIVQDSASPSKKTYELGWDFAAGYAEGIHDGIKDVKKSAEEITKSGLKESTDTQNETIQDFADSLANYLKTTSKVKSTFWQDLADGIDEADSKLQDFIKDLGITNLKEQLISDGAVNVGGIIGSDKVLIARQNTDEHTNATKTRALAELLNKAADAGVNVARILDVIESKNKEVFLEIQETAKGIPLQDADFNINTEVLKADDQQILKLVSDLKKLNELGIDPDIENISNVLYDVKKGFSLIDLGLNDGGQFAFKDFNHLMSAFIYQLRGQVEDIDDIAQKDAWNKLVDKVENISKDLIDTAEEATKKTQKSHSPSKVAEKLGEYWGEGYAEGILKAKGKVKDAIRALVETGKLTTADLLEDAVHTEDSHKVYNAVSHNRKLNKPSLKNVDIIKELDIYREQAKSAGFTKLPQDQQVKQSILEVQKKNLNDLRKGTIDAEKALIKLRDAYKDVKITSQSEIKEVLENQQQEIKTTEQQIDSEKKLQEVEEQGRKKRSIASSKENDQSQKGISTSVQEQDDLQKELKETEQQAQKASTAIKEIRVWLKDENTDAIINELVPSKYADLVNGKVFQNRNDMQDTMMALSRGSKFALEHGLAAPKDLTDALKKIEALEDYNQLLKKKNQLEKESNQTPVSSDAIVESEGKLLPIVVETNEEMQKRLAIHKAFLDSIGQSDQAKREREIANILEEQIKAKEQLNKEDKSNKNNLSSGSDKIAEQARAEMQAEEAAYDTAQRAKVEAERAGQAIVESQDKAQSEIIDTTTLLHDLSELLHNLNRNNLRTFNSSHGNIFGELDEDNIESVYQRLVMIKNVISKTMRNDYNRGDNVVGGMLDDNSLAKYNAYKELLEKIGYTLGEFKEGGMGWQADIVPISDKAIHNGEEMARILFDIQKYEQASNETPVQLDKEVQNFLFAVEQIKGSKIYNGIENVDQKIAELSESIHDNMYNAEEAFHEFVQSSSFDPDARVNDLEKEQKQAQETAQAEEDLANARKQANSGENTLSDDELRMYADWAEESARAESAFEESVVPLDKISEGLKEASKYSDNLLDSLEKLPATVQKGLTPIDGNHWKSLDRIAQIGITEEFRRDKKKYTGEQKYTEKQISDATNILKLAGDFQQTGDTSYLKELYKSIDSSEISGKMKKALRKSIKQIVDDIQKGAEQAIEEVPKEQTPKRLTKIVTKSKGEYKDYVKEKGLIADNEAFEHNFDLHLKGLERKGLAEQVINKNGRKGKWKIQVEVDVDDKELEPTEKQIEELNRQEREFVDSLTSRMTDDDIRKDLERADAYEKIAEAQKKRVEVNDELNKAEKELVDSLTPAMSEAEIKADLEKAEAIEKVTKSKKEQVEVNRELTQAEKSLSKQEKEFVDGLTPTMSDQEIKNDLKKADAYEALAEAQRKQIQAEKELKTSSQKTEENIDAVKRQNDAIKENTNLAKTAGDVLSSSVEKSTVEVDELNKGFEKLKLLIANKGDFNLRQKENKEALTQYVDQYFKYKERGGTRDLSELTDNSKVLSKLRKEYEKQLSLRKELSETARQESSDLKKATDQTDNFNEAVKRTSKTSNEATTQYERQITAVEKVTQAEKSVSKPKVNSKNTTDNGTTKSAKGADKEAKKLTDVQKAAQNAAIAKATFADANREVLNSIIDSLNGLNNEGKAFENLNKLINNLGGKNGSAKLQATVDGLHAIIEALTYPIENNSFISTLERIAQSGSNLGDIATILKASTKNLKNTVDTLSKPDTSNIDNLLDNNIDSVVDNAKKKLQELGGDDSQIMNISNIHKTRDGLLEIVAVIKTIDGEWREYTLHSKDGVEMQNVAMNENTARLAKQMKLYSQVEDYFNRKQEQNPNLTNTTFFDPQEDPELWKLILDYASEYAEELGEIRSITRQVRQDNATGELYESYSLNGSKTHVTIGREGETVATHQDILNVDELEKRIKHLKSTLSDYYKYLEKEANGTIRDEELLKLNKLREEYQQIEQEVVEYSNLLQQNTTLSENYTSTLLSGIETYNNVLSKYAEKSKKILEEAKNNPLGKNKQFTDSFNIQLDNALSTLKSFETEVLKHNNLGLPWDKESLKQIQKWEDQINKAIQGVKSKFEVLAKDSQVDKLLGKISRDINDNTRMPRQLRQEYIKLRKDIDLTRKSADGINEVKYNQLVDQFNHLHEQLLRIGKTGKSMFQQIADAATSRTAQAFARYFSFYDIVRYGSEAFGIVRQLDDALVDLRKTTTMNNRELEEFYFNSGNVAKELGTTTQQIIQQAANWSRLGYSSKEAATEMAALSSQFAAISPGMSLDVSTDDLVSTMQAFHIEVDQAEREIMDNVNRIGRLMPKRMVTYGVLLNPADNYIG